MRTKLLILLLSAAVLELLSFGADAQIIYRVINLGNPNGGTLSQGTSDRRLFDLSDGFERDDHHAR